ncbi:AraC family transcriptional regulator [Hoyosella sp. YIM 151337]|uniref:helix-turn-helix domain-containing protein n=1 Tax=Hoyosella sp. YIM 151337 TaxID=2992742 RepID=UPI002235EF40|nr:AraC family transcriptional regulator [Hoyosella sp. YIM 151337]MCW4352166.1 AraC family transcriptional regulator [Hoyosella sp. YIM 151337]
MKADKPRPLDMIERAHLKTPGDTSHTVFRYDPPGTLTPLVRRFWIPVWSVPAGKEAVQRVLRYPVALIVISDTYARFYGVDRGLSTTTLTGAGWAVGAMLQPAGGERVAGASMVAWRDRFTDLSEILPEIGPPLTRRVRAVMGTNPEEPANHHRAMTALSDALAPYCTGLSDRLINDVVAYIENDAGVIRVAQVCEKFGVSERQLQRLTRRTIGLSPKWIIQRRRLQEAAEHLRGPRRPLADVAADLGYADQAHFIHDFRAVTGMTPGDFAARFGD